MNIAASNFRVQLLRWYDLNARVLPWVNETDPYHIWLCEVIMQQTRVEQGIPFYQKFIKAFPTVKDLALAKEDVILKMWEGMGYYSRARNLYLTANTIAFQYKGVFPDSYPLLLKLKGVGPYMAAAILSYAWNKPYAVIDSNVIRIISRYFGISKPIQSSAARDEITLALNSVFDKSQSARFNQAMMDFGSLVCRPVNPDCASCPVNKNCFAYTHHLTDSLPVKPQKQKRKDRFFHFIVLRWKSHTVIVQRKEKDVWRNLFQFPLIESGRIHAWKELRIKLLEQYGTIAANWEADKVNIIKTQQLTHQNIQAAFFIVPVKSKMELTLPGAKIVSLPQLKNYAFPGIIRTFLNELV